MTTGTGTSRWSTRRRPRTTSVSSLGLATPGRMKRPSTSFPPCGFAICGPGASTTIGPAWSARTVAWRPRGNRFGRMTLVGDGRPDLLFCENESNAERLWGVPGSTPFPKDGINDHVVHGLPTVNPEQTGTKASLRYRFTVPPGQATEVRLRLSKGDVDLAGGWEATFAARHGEAGFYYDVLHLSGQDRLPHPFEVQVGAMTDYEPGESTSGLFGGTRTG